MDLNQQTRQIHLAKLKDKIIPTVIIVSFAQKQKHATDITFAKLNHQCCWIGDWKKILPLLNQQRFRLALPIALC